MNDKRLAAALREVYQPKLDSLFDLRGEDVEFSESFENKMRELYAPKRKAALKRRLKIGLLIAAIFAAGLIVGMSRRLVWYYDSQEAEGGSYVTFDMSTAPEPKKKMYEFYSIADSVSGCSFMDQGTSFSAAHEIFAFDDESKYIYFGQFLPSTYKDVFFSDRDRWDMMLDDSGVQYYINEFDGSRSSILWYYDGYVFLLTSSMNKDDALKLCRSLKIREKNKAFLTE